MMGNGFIGDYLGVRLREARQRIGTVDIKPLDELNQVMDDGENVVSDLKLIGACEQVCEGAKRVPIG